MLLLRSGLLLFLRADNVDVEVGLVDGEPAPVQAETGERCIYRILKCDDGEAFIAREFDTFDFTI